jgi:3-oxoadipate enol-lactonase
MPAVGRLRYLERLPRERRLKGTLVLIHAFPLNARMWEPQLELAEQGWRVLAPQLRGFDGGIGEPTANSMDDYAGDIVDLLDALHVHQAIVAGLSMGGYVAFAMLRLAARYFQGLVLADTRSEADTPEGRDARTRMMQLVRDSGAAGVADEMIPKLLSESARQNRQDLVGLVRELTLANPPDAIAAAIGAMRSRADSTPLLKTIGCPTLILVGQDDVVTPPAMSEQMEQAISGAERVVIPGAGHLSNLEQPSAFNGALARFLEHRL